MKNKLPNKISISNITKYQYSKKQYPENLEQVYNDYYAFLPNIIVINRNNYYYQHGSYFILFSESILEVLYDTLKSINFNEDTTNKYAENEKYAKRKLEAIKVVYNYLNTKNREIEK